MFTRILHKISASVLLLAGLICLWGCDRFGIKRNSSSEPFKVLVLNDIDNLVDSALSISSPGLPQYEPLADVTKSKGNMPKDEKLRTVVSVTLNKQYKEGLDIELSPSDIESFDKPFCINIKVSRKEKLAEALSTIQRLVVKSEIIREQKRLLSSHNAKAETLILKMFGKQMLVPKELTAIKVGKNFLWLSNNSADKMVNICLYRADMEHFAASRDSIMRQNIPGEKKGMYMQTDTIFSSQRGWQGSLTLRGLWQMRNDAMAGAFVAYCPTLSKKGEKSLVAEAFVFAPGARKRNLLRQAEASLYTLNIKYSKQYNDNI